MTLLSKPHNFVPAREVQWASFWRAPGFSVGGRSTGRKAAGKRYERLASEMLLEIYPEHYVPHPWLRFQDAGGYRWCQPDGLLIDVAAGRIVIVEMKLSHTADAWWQLKKLYLPVLRVLLPPRYRIGMLEVCKWHDPTIRWPERAEHLQKVNLDWPGELGIHIWNGDI